jgi:hypothetical protein
MRCFLLLLAWFCSASFLQAQAGESPFKNGHTLVEIVNGVVKTLEAGPQATPADKVDVLMLDSYLQGVVQMHEAMAPRGTGYFFKAPTGNKLEIFRILQKHLETTPDDLDMPALLHVIAAFRAAFPPDSTPAKR